MAFLWLLNYCCWEIIDRLEEQLLYANFSVFIIRHNIFRALRGKFRGILFPIYGSFCGEVALQRLNHRCWGFILQYRDVIYCYYGFVLQCLIHQIPHWQRAFPTKFQHVTTVHCLTSWKTILIIIWNFCIFLWELNHGRLYLTDSSSFMLRHWH